MYEFVLLPIGSSSEYIYTNNFSINDENMAYVYRVFTQVSYLGSNSHYRYGTTPILVSSNYKKLVRMQNRR